jgi:MHS family proline/betaine transporter-like MFS transporter
MMGNRYAEAFSYFPIFRRFTCVSMAYALSRAGMYLVTSFGLVYLNEWFGESGLLIIFLPCAIASLWGIQYFEKLEKQFKTPSNTQEKAE